MDVKLFEVRDSGTCMIVMAIQLSSRSEVERWMLAKSGFGPTNRDHQTYIMVAPINGGSGKLTSDAHDHGMARTVNVAHQYIEKNWETLKSGDLVCVEFILGERTAPKESERRQY